MENQSLYWNNVAKEKEFTTPFNIDLFCKHAEKTDKILDYGCGYGRTLNFLNKNGFPNLFGVDFSETMIERAQNENPFAYYSINKNNKVDFDNQTFDAVILFAVLTCINNECQ